VTRKEAWPGEQMLVQASAALQLAPQGIIAQVSIDEPGKNKDMGDVKVGR